MTQFERNARYSYSETLSNLIGNGWRWPHLQTMRYKGFDVITWADKSRNKIGNFHGFHAKFFYNGHLVKMRDKMWKDDINAYCKTYIDQVLIKNITEYEKSMDLVTVICYGQKEVMSRSAAIKKYKEGMKCCEGSERERYTNIYLQLIAGDINISDKS